MKAFDDVAIPGPGEWIGDGGSEGITQGSITPTPAPRPDGL